jgi:hypothetical protein
MRRRQLRLMADEQRRAQAQALAKREQTELCSLANALAGLFEGQALLGQAQAQAATASAADGQAHLLRKDLH